MTSDCRNARAVRAGLSVAHAAGNTSMLLRSEPDIAVHGRGRGVIFEGRQVRKGRGKDDCGSSAQCRHIDKRSTERGVW
eukprot:545582-Rhodomonas_salina.5